MILTVKGCGVVNKAEVDVFLELSCFFDDPMLLLLLLLSRFRHVRLCDPIDSSLPGSAVPGILQARVLEWVAIAFSEMIQ